MVHGQHRVKLAEHSRCESGICRCRAGEVEALLLQSLDRGNDSIDLFGAQVSAFSRMGIETAD